MDILCKWGDNGREWQAGLKVEASGRCSLWERGEKASGGEGEKERREGPQIHNPLTDSFVEWLTAQCATLEPEQREGGRHDWRDYLFHGLQLHPPTHHHLITPPSLIGSSGSGQFLLFSCSAKKKTFVSHDCVVLQIMLNAAMEG